MEGMGDHRLLKLLQITLVTAQVPAIVYYERVDLHEAIDYSGLPCKIDETILSHDTSISV